MHPPGPRELPDGARGHLAKILPSNDRGDCGAKSMTSRGMGLKLSCGRLAQLVQNGHGLGSQRRANEFIWRLALSPPDSGLRRLWRLFVSSSSCCRKT